MSRPKYDRQYLGVTLTAENYNFYLAKGGREEVNFHKKHLEAYLKGHEVFYFGFERDEQGNPIAPKKYGVQSKLTILQK